MEGRADQRSAKLKPPPNTPVSSTSSLSTQFIPDDVDVVGVWVSGGIDSATVLYLADEELMNSKNKKQCELVAVHMVDDSEPASLSRVMRVVDGTSAELVLLRKSMPNFTTLAEDMKVSEGAVEEMYWNGLINMVLSKWEPISIPTTLTLSRSITMTEDRKEQMIPNETGAGTNKYVILGTTNADERMSRNGTQKIEPLLDLDRTQVADLAARLGVPQDIRDAASLVHRY